MNRLSRNSIGYGAYGENFGSRLGDGMPPACVSSAQAVGTAGQELQVAQVPGPSGFPDSTRIYNAQVDMGNKQKALDSCIASNSGITAGDVATVVGTGVGIASIFTPIASLFINKRPQPQRPGQPPIVIQPGGQAPSSNTPIIIAAVAGVAVLLVVVLMMQKK